MLVGTGAAIESSKLYDIDDVFFWYGFIDVVTKPFLVTIVYNKVKKPAGPRRESRRAAVRPYVSAAAGEGGRPVPLYGVSLSF